MPNNITSDELEDYMSDHALVSRRGFLQSAGTLTATAALAGAGATLQGCAANRTEVLTEEEEQLVRVVCRPNCMQDCYLNAHVRDGRVVKTSPAPLPDNRYQRVCLRGLSHAQGMYHQERIKYPMRRVGERGSNEWERISWDEAIEEIVGTFTEIRKTYGKKAIGYYSMAGNADIMLNCMTNRFSNALECTKLSGVVDLNLAIGLQRCMGTQYYQQSNEICDYANAKTILAWGVNLTESQVQAWHFVADAIENGAKLITIDPNFSITASKSHQWVSLRPGSDTALAMAMMQVIVEEGLTDDDFLSKHTVAPYLVREDTRKFLRASDVGIEPVDTGEVSPTTGEPILYDAPLVWDADSNTAAGENDVVSPSLLGSYTVNGIRVTTAFQLFVESLKDYTPEITQAITDVDPEVVRDLARTYAAQTPSTIICGYGFDRYNNGHITAHALATLAGLTGNVGKKGASVGAYNRIGPMNGLSGNISPEEFPDQYGTSTTVSILSLPSIIETGMYNGEEYPIKALFIAMGNPLSNLAEQNLWLEKVWPKLDLVVATDMNFNDTVRYADIILPVAHWFETIAANMFGNSPYTMFSNQAVDPFYESKTDIEIWRLICDGLGKTAYFAKSADELMEEALNSATGRALGISKEALQREGAMRSVPGDVFIQSEGGVFATPTGRLEFYLENPYTFFNYGQDYESEHDWLPEFREPLEAWPTNKLAEQYPLVCIQEHTRYRAHTIYWNIPWLNELEEEPTVKIAPADADVRNIHTGDYVRVFNDRGSVVVRAVVTPGMREGMVNIPKGWQTHQFKEGSYQTLTQAYVNPVTLNQIYNDTLVQVEKA